jgi:hypothetical protein
VPRDEEVAMKTLLGSNSRKMAHTASSSAVLTPDAPDHEQIARLAYRIYFDAGCPAGRDLEFWLEAERQVMALDDV